MTTDTDRYRPDYGVPPGWVLDEHLAVRELSAAEFARRCGRSAKLISNILAGEAPIEAGTALQFEKVLGMDASIWMGIEKDYQLFKARQAETEKWQKHVEWYRGFPIKELIDRGYFQKPKDDRDGVGKLLTFFGVASVEAWSERFAKANVAYRHSPSFKSADEALSSWLRMGELEVESLEIPPYDANNFRQALQQIRLLTIEKEKAIFLPRVTQLCNDAGVAFSLVKLVRNAALSGASRWLSPRRGSIQLSARYKSDDHLWFSFFHEAAHLLLHPKKLIFINEKENKGAVTQLEQEADDWAANFLIPKNRWKAFKQIRPITKDRVITLAQELRIAPGIIVGRLQHEKALPWNIKLNNLKTRYRWSD
ncbi:MAG: ImmA/IrrE family metallo-endopeptidase [Magnetococcales bacterium]|nr:ImmA/IrrE family metallo-endopeptidase [Magnetococcales bacterium]